MRDLLTIGQLSRLTCLGQDWGPVDTIFTGASLLILAGGVYAAIVLHHVTLDAGTASLSQFEDTQGGAA